MIRASSTRFRFRTRFVPYSRRPKGLCLSGFAYPNLSMISLLYRRIEEEEWSGHSNVVQYRIFTISHRSPSRIIETLVLSSTLPNVVITSMTALSLVGRTMKA